ncbi:MAG: hypothetical protein LBT71_01085 [Azoarcus sp.]|jgi:hypothetical protein|nr:hypothetical protein [Azoarcus sp.]
MFIGALRLCSMTALWWAVLWYVLPLDFSALSNSAMLGLHAAPPLLAEAAWFAFKRLRTLRAKRAKEAAEKTGEAKKQAETGTVSAAREEALRHRRAHAECRALWLEMAGISDWLEKTPQRCTLFERSGNDVRGAGSKAVLTKALQQIFESVLDDEPLIWLPVYLVPGNDPGDDARRLEWIEQAWRQTAAARGIETRPRCALLPGEGALAGRVIDLFENDPELPALILLGMDSLLADGTDDADDDTEAVDDPPRRAPGHAVAAMLLSRPGLVLPADMKIAPERKEAGIYTPYWERGDLSTGPSVAGWGTTMARAAARTFLPVTPALLPV